MECQGVTFKGKSRKYITAYNRLKEKMVKGAKFNVKKSCLRIKETPVGKPMKVELVSELGEKGEAQIQMYKPGKKGATVLVIRTKGDNFEVVQTVANDFIEMFLGALMKGLIKGEAEMDKYIRNNKVQKEEELFGCEKCGRMFSTKHGLNIHAAWHTKKDKEVANKEDKLIPSKTNDSVIPQTMQQSCCENCEIFF